MVRISAIALAAGMVFAASTAQAQSWRWPWQKPSTPAPATPTPAPVPVLVPPAPPPVATPAPGGEQATLSTLHGLYQREIALANQALPRATDARTKAFAQKVIAEDTRDDATLQERMKAIGMAIPPERQPVAGFDVTALSGPAFDVAYLQKAMDELDSVRAAFADYKAAQQDHAFHGKMVTAWNDLVAQREEAKQVHDSVRNKSLPH